MSRRKWKKQTLKLQEGHRWEAKPGYHIVVLDRGAARFDVPKGWVMMPPDQAALDQQPNGHDGDVPPVPAIEMRDAEPPDDTCGMQISVLHMPTGVDWSRLPVTELLTGSMQGAYSDALDRGEVKTIKRPQLELAWRQTRFLDEAEQREAFARTILARRDGLHVMITFLLWVDDEKRLEPVWNELLSSLRLGDYISDPTLGDLA